MYENMTLKEFMGKLSSSEPVPGGGGASAVCASLAASLTSMVFNLTKNKKMFFEYDDNIKNIIEEKSKSADELRDEFIAYIEKDAEVFSKIIDCYKMPKNTPEEKNKRSKRLGETFEAAARVPDELAIKAEEVYDLIDLCCKYGNKNLISDAGCAAIMCSSAIESSVLNMSVNLSGIKDEKIKETLSRSSKELLERSTKRKNDIMKLVYNAI